MNKKLKKVFLIASITVCCIFIFQLYWTFNSYKIAEKNLNNTIDNTLKKSIELYQLKQLDSIPVIRDDDQRIYYAIKKQSVDLKKKKKNTEQPYRMIINRIEIPKQQLPMIKKMLLQLKASTLKSMDLKELAPIIKQELARNNIDIDFNLSLSHDKIPLKNVFYLPVQLSKDNILIKVQMNNFDMYIIKQNIVSLSVSLILILLSVGSYYFMALTIKRQLKLDDIKNDFINNMTHELRTPISILKSSNEALLNFNAIHDTDKAKRYLTLNNDILNKLDHNVDRILDIAQYNDRLDPPKLVKVQLNDLIISIINRFTINENANIRYINQLEENELYTDPYVIDTVLSNLLDNAVKYADNRVDILLKVSPIKNGIQFHVEDNGKGIDSAYLPYIFDKFFRVPSGNLHDVKGYGLGLSFVKTLVNTLNGEITVKSKINSGTTFIIKFPSI
ncbi:sensor histidine kinase [Chryseobacterium sp. OV279]|uniref:sensor histidine kinase n=1 Tax=Chryseobacterium sp. OV279 TaxID=1500285 RepID=UPI0009188FBA|nr:HAMP domain-containing sensor histidine kinase [Chryseobacterium sp. OV279]SHF38359.1 two-component system, OmpR family, phosphate regulon sensor histidine kinase PhoR [Chryseobacterium sp. OV279]